MLSFALLLWALIGFSQVTTAGGKAYTAHVASLTGGRIASVTQDRYLTVK
eukprot:COSAG04_NODE_10_length_43369_cov_4.059025_43_plen_50_part_00